MGYEPIAELAVSVVGIGAVVGLLVYLARVSMPGWLRDYLFEEHEWLVNVVVIVLSVGISFLGAWLNWQSFEARLSTEYVWRGLFSAGVATLGHEFVSNARSG